MSDELIGIIIGGLFTLIASVLASIIASRWQIQRLPAQNRKDDGDVLGIATESFKILVTPLNEKIADLEKQILAMNGHYHITIDLQVGDKPSATIISVIKAKDEIYSNLPA